MISARTSSLAILVSLVPIGASGCVIDDVDPSNRRCPCIAGWVCDEASDRCIEALTADAGDVVPDGDLMEDANIPADANVPVDAPPPPPFCETISDAIFCDDFETGDLTRWAIEPTAAEGIGASPFAAHAGGHGLRLAARGGAGIMRLTTSVITADTEDLYFRAWVRVSEDTAGTLDVFELFAGSEGSVAAQMLPGTKRFRVQIADAGGVSISDESDARWEIAAWNCVQGFVKRSELYGVVEIHDPAVPRRARLADQDTDWGTPYDLFKITVAPSEAGSQVDLDDIVWTRTPLPCP